MRLESRKAPPNGAVTAAPGKAADGQLRSHASILGAGFQAAETLRALAQAIEERHAKSPNLIDTPGYGPNDWEDAGDLARFLASRLDIEVHLVLSASMKSADLSRVVDRFEIFRPGKLLFTRLDETGTFGPIGNEAARTGKPVSFLASGRQIPEDLAPATPPAAVSSGANGGGRTGSGPAGSPAVR